MAILVCSLLNRIYIYRLALILESTYDDENNVCINEPFSYMYIGNGMPTYTLWQMDTSHVI